VPDILLGGHAYLLPQGVLSIIVALTGLGLLDARLLLLDLLVVACFFLDKAGHDASCNSELGRRSHVGMRIEVDVFVI
jgi:hypothetical protein